MALRRIGRLLGLSLVFCHLSFSSALAQSSSAWRDSLAVLNKAITANPQSTDLRLRKAAVNIELEQWDYAIEEYGRVLGIDANNLPALYYRAFAHNHLRHYDMARADYERFLQLLPRHFEARLGLAMTMRRQGKTRDVTDELNRLVQMFPDSAVAYAVRADFEQEQAQYDLALYGSAPGQRAAGIPVGQVWRAVGHAPLRRGTPAGRAVAGSGRAQCHAEAAAGGRKKKEMTYYAERKENSTGHHRLDSSL